MFNTYNNSYQLGVRMLKPIILAKYNTSFQSEQSKKAEKNTVLRQDLSDALI